MRVLIFHGYLLRGTGSNIYNASLAAALAGLGHQVHLMCQDRDAATLPFVDAVGRWRGGALEVEVVREPVRVTAYLPDIGAILPVYVADEYEGFEARPFPDLDDAEVGAYIAANVAAARELIDRVRPDAALANHAIAGPVVLARAGEGRLPLAVKIHGSALEYTVKPNPERFLPLLVEGLDAASGVLVGSRHTAESLWEAVGDPALPALTRLGPPGVDTAAFRPKEPKAAAAGLAALAERIAAQPADAAWGGDAEAAAAALRSLDPEHEPVVSFVGKLIVSKGVDLLLAAWPLVHARVPAARLCIVGFGAYRQGLERLARALARGDLGGAREVARLGREAEGGPPGELTRLGGFLDSLEGAGRDAYLGACAPALDRVSFTGRLEHEDLPALLAACSAQVVPSTFPEAFGMVAAEAACCGALPVSAGHSGLAEVSEALAGALEPGLQGLLSFDPRDDPVRAIADRIATWLSLEPSRRAAAAAALSERAHGLYGWERVAQGVVDAARGRLERLPEP